MPRLGLRRDKAYSMSDLIFEGRQWKPSMGLDNHNYFAVRVRLRSGSEPVLELKDRISEGLFDEYSFSIPVNDELMRFLSIGFAPSKIISKRREEYRSKEVVVTLDDVKHLGSFIEIEGSKAKVARLASRLGFKMKDRSRDYGWMMYQLMKNGKVSFTMREMRNELSRFGK